MKNKKIKRHIEKSLKYDSMVYKDIEKDLQNEKTPEQKKVKLSKRKRLLPKKYQKSIPERSRSVKKNKKK